MKILKHQNISSPGKKVSKSLYRDGSRRFRNTALEQRCPTHSPLATCGEWPFKCGEFGHEMGSIENLQMNPRIS